METKRFSKNDSGFICEHCGREVPPLGYTSRNHCPYCLWSLHVDEPVFAEPDPKKGYIITHRCTRCGALRRNKAASDDDLDLIIALTVNKNL